jgi:hypothetical protein
VSAMRRKPAEGPALRKPGGGASLPGSLGRALGRHAHPRHHQTAGRGHVRRRAAGLAAAAIEPFRYYQYGERTVHLDGCVEVEAAYYGAPPGWIGRRVQVQWDVPACPPARSQHRPVAARAPAPDARGGHRIKDEDRPAQTPLGTQQLLAAPTKPDRRSARSAAACTASSGRTAVRRILGVCLWPRSTARASVDDACAAALEVGSASIASCAAIWSGPATAAELAPGRSADPPTHRCIATSSTTRPKEIKGMNLIELQRALRQLRLGGIATVLETRCTRRRPRRWRPSI